MQLMPQVRAQDLLPFPERSEHAPIGPQESFTFEHVISILSNKLDRIHSGQVMLCAQVKDLRESLPMQRRPLSRWAQQIHVQVLNDKRGGLCPACESVRVCDETGRLPAGEYDHWYSRHRSRAEETWLICQSCNAKLNQSTEFKASARAAFESYQITLRRVLQAHQARQSTFVESAAS